MLLPAITIHQLTLAYGKRDIIRDFNANIECGEFIGIFGPNGAGKSTLLRAILGLASPASGYIHVLGKPTNKGNAHIGYMPQMHRPIQGGQLSSRTRLLATLNGFHWGLPLSGKKQRAKIDWALATVHASSYADRPFAELSGGERQRILLAQALLDKPKILLLDEPLTNLDPHHQETLIQLIKYIQQELNVTVLFTAHDVNPLLGIMNRVLYLARSNAAIGSVEEIITSEKLTWLYGSPIEVIHYHNRLFVISHERGNLHDTHHHGTADHF
jgi:zinc/manganese transport system ATP-binding protein